MSEQSPSQLRAALSLLVHSVRNRGKGATKAAAAPARRVAVERSTIAVDARRVARYRRVTGATLDELPESVPPLYPSSWETALALELFAAGNLPFPARGVIHQGGELVAIRPIVAGDRIRCRMELDRSTPHPRGIALTLKARNWNSVGQLCQEDSIELIVRQPGAGGRGARTSSNEEAASGEVQWRELEHWDLAANLGRRYARVSGDFNPIHLWSWSSRLLGFDRPILHGFCIEAMVAESIAANLWGGRIDALRRMRIRFRQPLYIPGRARLLVSEIDASHGLFQVASGDPSSRPYAEGEYVGGMVNG